MPIIYAFIDSQNVNLATRDCGWKLDFSRFYTYLKDKYGVSKEFLFIGYVAANEELYDFLKKAGYIVVFKPTLDYGKKDRSYTKGNVDAELVLHAMIEFSNYDKAIIISGDGDFYCLIEYLDKEEKLLNIIIPNSKKYSALFRKYKKYLVFLDKLSKKLGKK
jgi:uncharacterized LabA/DUF88 family protein